MDNFSIAVNKYLRDFAKISNRGKIIIFAVLAASFFFGIGVPFLVNNNSSYKPSKPIPIPTPIPLPAIISLSAGNTQIENGATFSAVISINSPNQGVDAADFEIKFDPNYLTVATVSGGNYFGLYPVTTILNDKVKISGIANLVNNKFIIPVGRGTIGTIVFKTLKSTPNIQITFDRTKTIVASKGQNILDPGKITDLTLSIK